jgi:hypothetical protein
MATYWTMARQGEHPNSSRRDYETWSLDQRLEKYHCRAYASRGELASGPLVRRLTITKEPEDPTEGWEVLSVEADPATALAPGPEERGVWIIVEPDDAAVAPRTPLVAWLRAVAKSEDAEEAALAKQALLNREACRELLAGSRE